MIKLLRITVSSLALSAFVVAPTVLVLSADVVVAKSDNGNKGGNGGNKGGNGGGKSSKDGGKPILKKGKASSHSTTNSKKSGSTGSKIKSDFKQFGSEVKGLFSKKKKSTKQVASKKHVTPVEEKGVLHPSNLGKLNGMINSSPNAKLAHMRNGNFNGTVGVAAALALSEYDYRLADTAYQEALAIYNDPETAGHLEAFDFIDGAPSQHEFDAAQKLVEDETADKDSQEYLDAVALLEEYDYENYGELDSALQDAVALTDGVDEDALREAVETAEEGAPDDSGVLEAQLAVLEAYKGELAPEDEAEVLDAVRTGFPTDDEIAAILPVEDDELNAVDPEPEVETELAEVEESL